MRFFRNLSVARKLAAGSLLTLALVGTLVALVVRQGDGAAREQAAERHARPLADGAPALDAIVAGNLCALGQSADLPERERQRALDQAANC